MRYKSMIAVFVTIMLMTVACKKESGDSDETGFSQEVQNIVSQQMIDSLRYWGLVIHEGKKPPAMTGIYNLKPNLCVFDNAANSRVGEYFDDYRYRFYNQDSDGLTISLDYKSLTGTDTSSGRGSYLSGSGNAFSAFVTVHGVSSGIPYTAVTIYSGIITVDGIQDFQTALYLKEKGTDPSGLLVPVGTSRIFKDGDGLSTINSFYRSVPVASSLHGILEY